jgi:hypothetical protein
MSDGFWVRDAHPVASFHSRWFKDEEEALSHASKVSDDYGSMIVVVIKGAVNDPHGPRHATFRYGKQVKTAEETDLELLAYAKKIFGETAEVEVYTRLSDNIPRIRVQRTVDLGAVITSATKIEHDMVGCAADMLTYLQEWVKKHEEWRAR